MSSLRTRRCDPQPIRALRFSVFAAVVLFCSACGGIPAPQPFQGDPTTFHRALAQIEQDQRAYQGELKTTLWRSDERIRGRQLFLIAPPDRLRLTLLSPFEQPISDLVYREKKLFLWFMKENRFFSGPASARAFARLTQVEISPALFSGLLRGAPPRVKSEGGSIRWDEERGRYLFTLNAGSQRQEFALSADLSTLYQVQFWADGVLKYRLSLADHRDGHAHRMRIEHPEAELRLDLRVVDLSPLEEVTPDLFELSPPSGVNAEPL